MPLEVSKGRLLGAESVRADRPAQGRGRKVLDNDALTVPAVQTPGEVTLGCPGVGTVGSPLEFTGGVKKGKRPRPVGHSRATLVPAGGAPVAIELTAPDGSPGGRRRRHRRCRRLRVRRLRSRPGRTLERRRQLAGRPAHRGRAVAGLCDRGRAPGLVADPFVSDRDDPVRSTDAVRRRAHAGRDRQRRDRLLDHRTARDHDHPHRPARRRPHLLRLVQPRGRRQLDRCRPLSRRRQRRPHRFADLHIHGRLS